MNFQQAIEFIEESNEFKSFFIDNKDYYLAHGFASVEKNEKTPWEIGYYSKSSDKIVVFVAGEKITRRPEEEAFKKDGVVPILRIDDVNTSLDEALDIAEKFRAKEHSAEIVTKQLCIIQTIDDVPTWNMTMITLAFNMLNIRIDARGGEILGSKLTSILNLGERV